MRRLAPCLALVAFGCAHPAAAPPAVKAASPRDARACAPIGRTLGVDSLTFGAVLRTGGSCAQPGAEVEARVRAALVQQLAETGCFAAVVDLQSPGAPPVELTLSATVAQLEACAYSAATAASEQAAGAAFLTTYLLGAPIGGAVAAGTYTNNQGRGGWAAAQLVGVSVREAQRSLWRRGVVTVAAREAGQMDRALEASDMLDRATTLTAQDLARKLTRVAGGDSPYGVITLSPAGPERRPSVAILGGEGADDAQALEAIPAPLRTQLGRGYPLVWPADRFAPTRDAPTQPSAVVALFTSMEDATDWILTRNPRVKGLRMVAVK